jgi:hypothetical protein
LSLVGDCFLSATVEVFKRALESDFNVRHRFGHNFIQSSLRSAKVTSFNLRSFGVNNFTEGVLVQEELLENLVAILLVKVASTTDAIGSNDS